VSSSYPRFRPTRVRTDDNRRTGGGFKPPNLATRLTDGQVDFLDALTGQQRQRLENQPDLRAGLLAWFRHGPDRILYHEAMRLLASHDQFSTIREGPPVPEAGPWPRPRHPPPITATSRRSSNLDGVPTGSAARCRRLARPAPTAPARAPTRRRVGPTVVPVIIARFADTGDPSPRPSGHRTARLSNQAGPSRPGLSPTGTCRRPFP